MNQRICYIADLIIREAKERLKPGYTPIAYVSKVYSVSVEVDAIIQRDMDEVSEERR